MSFEAIDPVLSRWALGKSCPVLTKYKDAEVRSIIVDTGLGFKYQLWIDPPDSSSSVTVHLWDFAEYHQSWVGHTRDLEEMLERAWSAMERRLASHRQNQTPSTPNSDEDARRNQ